MNLFRFTALNIVIIINSPINKITFIVLQIINIHSTLSKSQLWVSNLVLATLCVLLPNLSTAQNNKYRPPSDSLIECYTIQEITLAGHKKTKDFIITRELDFKVGDLICNAELKERLLKNENRVFNTGLFLSVKTAVSIIDSATVNIIIILDERFYSYPIPLIGLADRNFSEWWNQRGHDLSRLDWGIRFVQKNVRGRNETLRIRAEFGFNKKFEVDYTFPYLNKKQKTGLSIYGGAIFNRQVAYATVNHKLAYTEDDGIIRTRYAGGFTFFRRNNFYQTHSASFYWYHNSIQDTVAILNPNYFLEGRTSQNYPTIRYSFTDDHRDIQYYPLRGYYIDFDLENDGAFMSNEIDYSFAKLELSKFTILHKRIFAAANIKGKISTPSIQPYFNQRGLGYDKESLSGYELYVIDGQHYVYSKLHLKWQIFSIHTNIKEIPIDNFQRVPLALYFKLHANGGYVENKYPIGNERFANKWLYGYGVGFDFVTYYDFVIRAEYSINGAGEGGFYINFKAGI